MRSLADLPPGAPEFLAEAAAAIVQEHRESTQVVELRCFRVARAQPHDGVTVARLDVGFRVELDWTWEGSQVWQEAEADASGERDVLWRGEVVAVDEVRAQLWVAIEGEVVEAVAGRLWLRPFPFLEALRRVYAGDWPADVRESLPARLRAALMGAERRVDDVQDGGAGSAAFAPPFGGLRQHAWSCLWGPPGTGKTRSTGAHVAQLLQATGERVLVVSTTNKATDAVALAAGRALLGSGAAEETLLAAVRAGRGADYAMFKAAGLVRMLDGGDSAARLRMAELSTSLRHTTDVKQRAWLRALLRQALREIESHPGRLALATQARAVFATVHAGVSMLLDPKVVEALSTAAPPFDTVIIDEAGMVSRAATAALSLLTRTRVLLVGDPRQLAPIARICRVLPPVQARWLAESALGHLRPGAGAPSVAMLTVQHRMHPELRAVVSAYQYAGALTDGEGVGQREAPLSAQLHKVPRASWYVLDEETESLAAVRAERGPGNKSWVRPITTDVLDKLFAAMPELKAGPGLFVSPFVAQARAIERYFAQHRLTAWSASTVHAQQGIEADYVVFDTVHGGAHVWSTAEWMRLINVALSRGREFAFVLASRQEMVMPFLAPLRALLPPRCLVASKGDLPRWRVPKPVRGYEPTASAGAAMSVAEPSALGAQLAARKALQPLLSRDQQRLCELTMDGKPRLVRGVAGSGKTIVLAHWLVQVVAMLAEQAQARIWVVYANRALKGLIEDHVVDAWQRAAHQEPFPWQLVEVRHIKDLLRDLSAAHGLGDLDIGFDYERGAGLILHAAGATLTPVCDALFVDEAQDLGHTTLHLLTLLVRCADAADARARNVIVFYDNAQNVYGRGTPTWADLGLDMRGRSTVLKESFRATAPIIDFALNVLYRLERADLDVDHKELVRRGLLEETKRRGRRWIRARFSQVSGPLPQVHVFADLRAELDAVGARLQHWIGTQGVLPKDIRLLYAGADVAKRARQQLPPFLSSVGARLQVQTSEDFARDDDLVLLTTPHSFKGYDAEIVVVLGVDRFVTGRGPLGHPLYVALTRARSVLEVYAQTGGASAASLGVIDVLRRTADDLTCPDERNPQSLAQDDMDWIVSRLGEEHRAWVVDLSTRCVLRLEPVVAADGETVATPLFTYERGGKLHACVDPEQDSPALRQRLEDLGVEVVEPAAG
jgi:hypothetical protein